MEDYRKLRLLVPAALALALTLGLAPATPLPPGATIDLNGSTGASNPAWAGTSVLDEQIPFEISNSSSEVILRGVYQNRVRKSSSTGNLIFAPRIRNLVSPTGTAEITLVAIFGFGGFPLDVEYATDGLGEVGPNSAQRPADPNAGIEFRFNSPSLVPPDSSYFLNIVTDTIGFSANGEVGIVATENPDGGTFVGRVFNVAAPIVIDPNRIDLTSITREDNGRITLCWNGAANVSHEIQWSADAQTWTTFRSRIVKASPACQSFFPVNGTLAEYYRVIVP